MHNVGRLHFIARAVMLAALLTGLLFSSGEGVHLFPFPVFDVSINPGVLSQVAGTPDYQENLLRFEKKPDSGPSKHQRQDDRWNSFASALFEPRHPGLHKENPAPLTASNLLFKLPKFVNPTRGRAPPVS